MRKVGIAFLSIILLVVLAVPVLADGPDGDVVIFGDNYTLRSGQSIDGDLFVYGGNVDLEEDSEVEGDVIVFGGQVDIRGEVHGDVTVWGGNVEVRSGATVRGQVLSIGGSVNREEGADVRGEEWEGLPFRAPSPPKLPRAPIPPQIRSLETYQGWQREWFRSIGNVFRSVFGVIVLVVLSILIVVFIPKHADTVAETIVKAPMQSFLTGLAAWIAVPIVATVLLVTICLSPIAALLLLVAGVALLFGWIAAGLLLGVKVLRAVSKSDPNHVAAVALGVLILTLLSFVPCIGFLVAAVVLTWGMGAVAYSLFGTRAYTEPFPKILSGSSKPTDYDPRIDQE